MKIYLLEAEHFAVPGRIVKAFDAQSKADAEAAELVNVMLVESGYTHGTNAERWQHHIERLQEEYGAQHCYVEISELDVH